MKIINTHILIFISIIFIIFFIFMLNPELTSYVIKQDHYCGDGKCTLPYEDETLCPQDCSKSINITPYVILIITILILGFIYINYYRGKFNLRELTRGKIPFPSEQELQNVVSYIEKSKEKLTKKQIIKRLLERNWNSKQIWFAFEELKWKKQRISLNIKKNIPKKTPNLKPLDDYIFRCLSARMPIQRIKANLLSKGWKKSVVKKAIKKHIKSR